MICAGSGARVREALKRTDVMALSTIDEDGGPWTSPVQCQRDGQLNLYFASISDAGHVRNIELAVGPSFGGPFVVSQVRGTWRTVRPLPDNGSAALSQLGHPGSLSHGSGPPRPRGAGCKVTAA